MPGTDVVTAVSDPAADPEAHWLRETYRPDAKNLTVRAAIVGIVVGALMCLSNIYVFFKTGWSLGVTLTACLIGFSVFELARRSRLVREPLGMLENNAMTTVASGAGYITAGGNAAALGALLMVTTVRPSQIGMIAWFATISVLGVFAAIPLKRQLINRDALPFPSGIATAETLRLIHGTGKPGSRAVLGLVIAAGAGALVAFARDGVGWIATTFGGASLSIAGIPAAQWTISLRAEVLQLGAGALMSWRTGWSLLVGAVATYAVLAPTLYGQGLISDVSYPGILAWTLWPGAAILVGAGLTRFALDYQSLGRAMSGLVAMFTRSRPRATGIDAVESPHWWFGAAFIVLTPVVVLLMSVMFDIPWWAALVSLPLAYLMSVVAARVTGETDITPATALGPVTQAAYGAMTPGSMAGNLMAANVTAGVSLHAADLLTTLKTGWLLGAKPRHQLYAQLVGVFAGSVMIVVMFDLVLDPAMLGTDQWPAPACTVWAGVSRTFVDGLDALPDAVRIAVVIGFAIGVVLAVVEKYASDRVVAFVPSAFGLGLAMVVPASSSFMMFGGAALGELVRRRRPQQSSAIIPIASGLIAGESLMGIGIQIVQRVFGG